MNYWNTKLTIANRQFPRFMGGPLDGITDSPFRKLVRMFSPEELLYTEMRHVRSIAHKQGGQRALAFDQSERPLSFQIAANTTEGIEQAIEKILQAGVDAIDLNIGCPAKNVVKSGGGSALMADPERLERIVKSIRSVVPIPFTVKIRSGYKQKNATEIAKLLQDCGVDAVAIHPRLQTERFMGRPDYALVAQVKRAVSIPVLLSGNVVNFKTAKLAYEQTGVDGFLIGRGIWGRPWKLLEMKEHAQGRPFTISNEQILQCALQHLDWMLEYYGPHGLYCFRKHLPFYLRGFPHASVVRRELSTVTSADQMRDGITRFYTQNG